MALIPLGQCADKFCRVCNEQLEPRRAVIKATSERNAHRGIRYFHPANSQCKFKRGYLPVSLMKDYP